MDDFYIVELDGSIHPASPSVRGSSPELLFEEGAVVYRSGEGTAFVFDGIDATEYELVSMDSELGETSAPVETDSTTTAEPSPMPSVSPDLQRIFSRIALGPSGYGLMRRYSPPLPLLAFNLVPQVRALESGYYVPMDRSPSLSPAGGGPNLFYVLRSSH